MAGRAVHHRLPVRFVTGRTLHILVLSLAVAVGGVRVVRQIGGRLGELLARDVMARLVQAERVRVPAGRSYEVGERLLLKRRLEVSRRPLDALADLLGQRGLVAREAGLTHDTVGRGKHATRVLDRVAPLAHALRVEGLLVSLQVGVHRVVADRTAEAGLLVPHPKARAGDHNDCANDASDDADFLFRLLASGSSTNPSV